MAAEGDAAALLDGRHDLQLAEAQVTVLVLPPRRPVSADEISATSRTGRSTRGYGELGVRGRAIGGLRLPRSTREMLGHPWASQ
jgi:hypothetical protein